MKKMPIVKSVLSIILSVLLVLTMTAGCAQPAAKDSPEQPAAQEPQQPQQTEQPAPSEKLEADVVVVGAGASGVSAAVAAADKGAKVILLEKTAVIGGASNISWAGKFLNSTVAVENGLVIDLEQYINEWIEFNHWRVDAAVLREYVTNSGYTYTWLTEKGYPTSFFNFGGKPMHLLPDYAERPGLMKKLLADSVEKIGGQALTETTGTKLLTNDKGEVTGVLATKKDGTVLEITAKAVVLATGGYGGNQEMVKEYSGYNPVRGGLSQNIGEGEKMAWEIGAEKPKNLGIQMYHQTVVRATDKLKQQYSPDKASYPLTLSYLPSLMNLSANGARFRDESAVLVPNAAANTAIYQGPFFYTLVSKSQIETLMKEGMQGLNTPRLPAMPPEFYLSWKDKFTLDNPWEDLDKVLESMVANGDGYKGETLEELAANAGMDLATLTETFNNYEKACKTGKDEDFGKDASLLIPYGEGPYYAVIAEINSLGSVGGLTVNKKFQVLNEQKVPIKGLYAVGLISQGVLFSDAYVGDGDGIGYAFTSGRLGGEAAAAEALGL